MTRYSDMLYLLAVLTINSHAAPVEPTNNILPWSCTGDPRGNMTEICNVMCYGINCIHHPDTLYWDKKTVGDSPEAVAKRAERHLKAGCEPNNRCTRDPFGEKGAWACSEYPFNSVDPNREMSQGYLPINRCVPTKQQQLQDDVLNQFYTSDYKTGTGGLHDKEGWFKLTFQNYAGVPHCGDESQRNCNNGKLNSHNSSRATYSSLANTKLDGNIEDTEGPAKPNGPP